jgi:hypothetical protein
VKRVSKTNPAPVKRSKRYSIPVLFFFRQKYKNASKKKGMARASAKEIASLIILSI